MASRHRTRLLGIIAAIGLSLTGCVAYDEGYGSGYYGGGYYGGGYGVTSVNVYAPSGYRHGGGHHYRRHHDGGGYQGGHHGGGRPEGHHRRHDRHYSSRD